jgi:glycosyltransferase involved in cell wall biosynthesis
MNDTHAISVIMPVYNSERYIASALESIERQTLTPLEVIVVDDGSTDRSAEIAGGFGGRIRSAIQENRGPAAARNHGLRLARGDVIAFLDADDLWSPDKLRRQADLLDDDPPVDVVWGYGQYFTEWEIPSGGRERKLGRAGLLASLGCGLIRRRVFDQVGGFDEAMIPSEDIDWIARARHSGISFREHADVVLYYRQHETNLTRDVDLTMKSLFVALKRAADRRRKDKQTESPPPTDTPEKP